MAVATVVGLSGCTMPATPETRIAEPGPPPEPFSATSKKTAGEQVAEIFQYCSRSAIAACPGATIRCDAFRPGYVKSCLLKGNVPPSYITAMMSQ